MYSAVLPRTDCRLFAPQSLCVHDDELLHPDMFTEDKTWGT